MKHDKHPGLVRYFGVALGATLALAGCAGNDGGAGLLGSGTAVTASAPNRMTTSGFLSNYGRLARAPWGDGVECWRDAGWDARKHEKILISPIAVTLKPDEQQAVDPADLKALADYFHASLEKAVKAELTPTNQPGPQVLVMRVALTNLVPTGVGRSVTGTLIPYAFIAEAGSGVATGGPPGSTPYLGQTGMEMQFRDGASDTVLAECRDTEIGRKYAASLDDGATGAAQTWASGYLNSFQSWAYARNAFDKWSRQTAERLAILRGKGAGT